MAGITVSNVDLAEVHDCFTIAEIVATEDLGFFAPGEDRGRWTKADRPDGDHPINTSGGQKGPKGASRRRVWSWPSDRDLSPTARRGGANVRLRKRIRPSVSPTM
ncbi:MAG: hypothetical protein CM1200mP22_17480 [Dehalococcoidia bacterium]|nr:MAG: hypothetical protein CM1200mP22_17480 [Dehalococcoidia bacterium]